MPDFRVFDSLDVGVQVIDHDLRYAYLNERLGAEVGRPPAELVGHRMVDMFPGIDTTDIYGEIVRCLETRQPNRYVNEFTFEDGRMTYYELDFHSIPEGVLIFSRDITETRRGELLLQETAKSQEHFAHLAAHDLREPVRRMLLLAEELQLDFAAEMPAPAAHMCGALHTQAQGLMRLIDDFRSLSSIAGGTDHPPEPVSLKDAVDDAVAAFSEQLSEHGRTVQVPDTDLVVQARRSLVGILLRNLLDNALNHGHGDIQVAFGTRTEVPVVSVSNATNNPPLGRDPFLPFVGRDRSTGTGLGLAIVRRVVAKHQGEVWAEHADGRFTVHFTLAPVDRPPSS